MKSNAMLVALFARAALSIRRSSRLPSRRPTTAGAARAVDTVPGMPPVVDPSNLYSETGAGDLAAAVEDALPRVYVPNSAPNDVYVIDPATLKVVDRFRSGAIRSTSCRRGTCDAVGREQRRRHAPTAA